MAEELNPNAVPPLEAPAPGGMPGPDPNAPAPGMEAPSAEVGSPSSPGGNPMVRQMKSQLMGLEQQRAKSKTIIDVKQRALENLKEVVLDSFQELLESYGVDVNNTEEIRFLIEEIEKANPDMAELLETVFTVLKGEDETFDFSGLSDKRDLKKRFNEINAQKDMEEPEGGLEPAEPATEPVEPPLETTEEPVEAPDAMGEI